MKVNADHLERVIITLLKKMGAGDLEARRVASVLVSADLRGKKNHGCAFIPLIAKRLEHGVLTIPTRIDTLVDDGPITHLDGNNGLGQMAATEAMRICIEKARAHGISLTLVRNTNHIGVLGYYSLMAADEDMIGACMTNAAPAVAPWGGTEPYFGTNPISLAAPVAEAPPIVLDMSSSITARGNIRRAERLNETIPVDWALDAQGLPTTDPAEALKGSLLPVGGPKGYGLAFFVDLICGMLSGSRFGRELSTFHSPERPTGVGAAFLALDIDRFMPLAAFKALVRDHAASIRNTPSRDGVDTIQLPGEIGFTRTDFGLSHGVEVDGMVATAIDDLLDRNGLSIRLEATFPRSG